MFSISKLNRFKMILKLFANLIRIFDETRGPMRLFIYREFYSKQRIHFPNKILSWNVHELQTPLFWIDRIV
jgi:hypothetical protein